MNARKIIAPIVFAVVLASTFQSARATELTFQCTNPASHAVWTLKIDDIRQTADGFPALITRYSVTWRDATNGGRYELDRNSGALTYTNASSTGGYTLFHHCQLK